MNGLVGGAQKLVPAGLHTKLPPPADVDHDRSGDAVVQSLAKYRVEQDRPVTDQRPRADDDEDRAVRERMEGNADLHALHQEANERGAEPGYRGVGPLQYLQPDDRFADRPAPQRDPDEFVPDADCEHDRYADPARPRRGDVQRRAGQREVEQPGREPRPTVAIGGAAGREKSSIGAGDPAIAAPDGLRRRRFALVSAGRDDGSMVGEDAASAVRVRGLTKAYGDVEAVRGLDLDISRGEIFALLGPNGAGKTTTVEILEGYRKRDGGEVAVLGVDPGHERARLKPQIGIVLQSTGVERYLTVVETVAMYAGFYPHPRPVDEVIDLVGLNAKRGERVIRLSGGQQRRLDVAIALAGDPELLFLDEPTTGFDPSARHEVWDVIKNLAHLGKTVLLTTHYMDEAQFLADRVAVVARGRIVAEGPPGSLGDRDRPRR